MEVLEVIGAIIVIAGIVWSSAEINSYCETKYGYPPYNILKFLALVLAVACVYLGIFLAPQPHITTAMQIIQNAYHFKVAKEDLNTLVLFILAVIIVLAVFLRIAFKTNIFVAIYATLIQLIAAIVIVTIIIVILMISLGNKKDDKKDEKENDKTKRK